MMDKPSVPAPSKDGQEQLRPAVSIPAPNAAFGGVVEQNNSAVAPIVNTYAAAAAALAMANQQVAAQSLQLAAVPSAPQQTNAALRPHANTNPCVQPTAQSLQPFPQVSQKTAAPVPVPVPVPSSLSNASMMTSSSSNSSNEVTAQNAQQAMATMNALQQMSFPFPPQHLAAALLGTGGLLPFANQAPTPTPPNNIQQQCAVGSTFSTVNNGSDASSQSVPAIVAPAQQANANAPNVPRDPAVSSTAAAQVVAAQAAAAAATSGVMAHAVFANMQNWKLDQLEAHVKLLQDTNQAVPQPVALLLADARRKEEKRTAKRAANRKSACSSRARKKALVEEMTKANARLRRQAMILALLPDLVITITVDGKITFCSAQVERVLRHKISHLVGANVSDILMPSSQEKLGRLIEQLVAAEQAATGGSGVTGPVAPTKKTSFTDNGMSSGQDIISSTEINPVSDGSFPLTVVDVANGTTSAEDNSDLSTSNNGGGKVVAPPAAALAPRRSPASTLGNGRDNVGNAPSGNSPKGATVDATDSAQVKSDVSSGAGSNSNQRTQTQASSDDSLSSSIEAKNLLEANEALGRNVRWHNEKMEKEGKTGKKKPSHKDDVTGASVTANNASARLSSLQVRAEPSAGKQDTGKSKPSRYDRLAEQYSSSSSDKKSSKNGIENSSEDSGYRESNQSEEESDDDCSSLPAGPRPKPLAPTCNICLIRDDLTTIWCEVTSSIRTRSLNDENSNEQLGPLEAKARSSSGSAKGSKTGDDASLTRGEIKELLLCLRPIREGDETVDESLRFIPPKNADLSDSGDPSSSSTSVDGVPKDAAGNGKQRPPKKRPIVSDPSSASLSNESRKKPRLDEVGTEKNAVESLMLMGSNFK